MKVRIWIVWNYNCRNYTFIHTVFKRRIPCFIEYAWFYFKYKGIRVIISVQLLTIHVI